MENFEIPYSLITKAISVIIILVVSTIIIKILKRGIVALEKRDLQEEGIYQDSTRYNFIKNSIGIVVYTIATILIINVFPSLQQLGTALFAGAGVVAAILGFASQQAFSNIISGIFILIFKPFRLGDAIQLNNGAESKGIVTDITLRHTIIRDYENRRIIIPNSVISEATITNSTIDDERIKKHIEVGIGYDSDIDKAIAIIQDEVQSHPFFIDGRTDREKKKKQPPVVVKVISLADFSVNLRAYCWAKGSDNAFILQCDVLKSTKERFDREGIEIPYPYRNVITKQ